MKLNQSSKILTYVLSAVALVALLVWAFIEGRNELAKERKRERPLEAPSRVHFEEGRAEVVLDTGEQTRAGITTETIPLTLHQRQIKVYATVVPIQQVADVYQSYASQKAQTAKTMATVAVSQKEYLRIKDLYEKRLESDKTLQTTEADWQSDDAAAQAARSALRSLESSMRQQWGGPIASWILNGSAELDALLKHQNVLIEVTLSSEEQLSPIPHTALVQLPSSASTFIRAEFVSTAQSADARFQGAVLYYIAPSSSNGLLGGMNVSVFLPTGSKVEGVVVPHSAAVWWQGKAWFYTKKDSDTFVRLELPANQPLEMGWFVPKDRFSFSGPLQILTRGAQLLLSEEFRSQIQVGEEGEKE